MLPDFVISPDRVLVDAELASLKLLELTEPLRFGATFKVRIDSIEQAEAVNDTVPGTVERFVVASDKNGEKFRHPKGQVNEQIGESGPTLTWTVVQVGDLGPMTMAGCVVLMWTGPIRTLTVSGNNGTCTLTISVRGELPVRSIPDAVALRGQRVRVVGIAAQQGLPIGGAGAGESVTTDFGGEPETVSETHTTTQEPEFPPEAGAVH